MIVSSAIHRAVSDVVLGAGDQIVRVVEILLKSANHRCTDLSRKIGIFTLGLDAASPARVVGKIEHRRKRPVKSVTGACLRDIAEAFLNKLRIKGSCASYSDGVAYAVAVNDVGAEHQRNVARAFLDCDFLKSIVEIAELLLETAVCRNVGSAADHRTDLSAADPLGVHFDGSAPRYGLIHLPDLLLERQRPDYFFDSCFCFCIKFFHVGANPFVFYENCLYGERAVAFATALFYISVIRCVRRSDNHAQA